MFSVAVAVAMFATAGAATIADAPRWRMLSVRAVGGDARIELEPVR